VSHESAHCWAGEVPNKEVDKEMQHWYEIMAEEYEMQHGYYEKTKPQTVLEDLSRMTTEEQPVPDYRFHGAVGAS
jgi:hypothetical protein